MTNPVPSKELTRLIERVSARIPSSVTPSTRIEIHPSEWLMLVDAVSAPEPPVECAGCIEFVKMQQELCGILGVEEEEDALSQHDRIMKGIQALISERAAQPPPAEPTPCAE